MENHFAAVLARAAELAAERDKDPAVIAEREAEAERTKREAGEWPYRASGIAAHLKPGDLEMLVARKMADSPAASTIREWFRQYREPSARLDRWRPWLWVGGPCGTGKTMAAAEAIANMSPDRDAPRSRYVTFRYLVQAHRDLRAWDRDARRDARELLDRSTRGALVVLDEVGQELDADREMGRLALADFVEHRQHSDGLTLVLSNKSAAEIRRRFTKDANWYDERTESRLRALLSRDTSGGAFRDLKGKDMRGDPC